MIKIIKGLIVAAIISAFSFAAFAADSKKPTRIPTHNWSSQIVMAYAVALKKMSSSSNCGGRSSSDPVIRISLNPASLSIDSTSGIE